MLITRLPFELELIRVYPDLFLNLPNLSYFKKPGMSVEVVLGIPVCFELSLNLVPSNPDGWDDGVSCLNPRNLPCFSLQNGVGGYLRGVSVFLNFVLLGQCFLKCFKRAVCLLLTSIANQNVSFIPNPYLARAALRVNIVNSCFVARLPIYRVAGSVKGYCYGYVSSIVARALGLRRRETRSP